MVPLHHRQAVFGAARNSVLDLFDSIGDALELPEDRGEWDFDDYEDEREELAQHLVRVSARMGAMKQALRNGGGGGGQRLTRNMAVSATGGARAVVIPLEAGVFLVAEASDRILQSTHPEDVRDAIEDAAYDDLSGREPYFWQEYLG